MTTNTLTNLEKTSKCTCADVRPVDSDCPEHGLVATQVTKTTTMSREEVECGYCKRVQTNRGGNLGYNCKKHRKSGMSITKITLYTEEQLKEKLTSRDNEWRERIMGMKEDDTFYAKIIKKCDCGKVVTEYPRELEVRIRNKIINDLLEQMEDKK